MPGQQQQQIMENSRFGLSEEQRKRFEAEGILVVEDFLSPEEVQSMKDACRDLVQEMDPDVHKGVFSATKQSHTNNEYFLESNDKIRFFFEKDAFDEDGRLKMAKDVCLNKIGHALHYLDPAFKKVSFSPKVKAVAKSLGFVDPVVVQGMYIFKQPRIGEEVTPHQDASFLANDPLKLLGFWFPIDDATLENGCLSFVPGSHKTTPVKWHMIRNPMYNNRMAVEEESMLIFEGEDYPKFSEHQWTPAPVKKGSLVLIDGAVMHKSGPNTSEKPRHAYTFHMVETRGCTYRKTNWLQPSKEHPFPKLFSQE